MNVVGTTLPGVLLVEADPRVDSRGYFYRGFCDQELDGALAGGQLRQVNLTLTLQKGSLRGLHYQRPPAGEIKFVRCIRGCVFDVVVDLRRGSETFLRWFGVELSAENKKMLVVPVGCAHGFQTLQDNCEMLYLHTAQYAPQLEGGVRFSDPLVGIDWPLPPQGLSARDAQYPLLTREFRGVEI